MMMMTMMIVSVTNELVSNCCSINCCCCFELLLVILLWLQLNAVLFTLVCNGYGFNTTSLFIITVVVVKSSKHSPKQGAVQSMCNTVPMIRTYNNSHLNCLSLIEDHLHFLRDISIHLGARIGKLFSEIIRATSLSSPLVALTNLLANSQSLVR